MNTGVPRQVDSVLDCRNEFVCISEDRLNLKSASLQTMGHSVSIGFGQIHVHSAVMSIAEQSGPAL